MKGGLCTAVLTTLARDDGCRSYVKSFSLFAGIEMDL